MSEEEKLDSNKPEFGSSEAASMGGHARRDNLSADRRREIAKNAINARWNKTRDSTDTSATDKSLTVKKLPVSTTRYSATPGQGELFVDKAIEIDGVGMGVLSNGTPFLTGRGLARLCGTHHQRINELAPNWKGTSKNAMAEGVKKILQVKNLLPDMPYVAINQRSGIFHAYSDVVCIAVLEYYAFDQPLEEAKKNFRILAGKALGDFIYAQVGYDPSNHVPEQWRQFHDRVSLTYNSVPSGHFCVFKEIADMIVHLGQHGLHIDEKFIPDISVGICWSKYWEEKGFDKQYGLRRKFAHNYPNYFPQAKSNPQLPWAYPEMSLGEFKRWLRESYIKGGKFEKYLTSQVDKKALPPSFAQIAVAAYGNDIDSKHAQLPPPSV